MISGLVVIDASVAHDACYVALSRSLRAPLVTADGRLVKAISRGRDRVIALGSL